jgi:hypothetical protein
MASSYECWAGPRAPTLAAEKLVRIPVYFVAHLVPPSPAVSQTDTQRPHKCLLKSHFSGLVSVIEGLFKII